MALLIYNVPNLVIRYMGFNAGWNDGVHVVRRFKSRWVEDSIAFLRWLVFLCSGSLTAVALILAEEHAKAHDVENFVGLGLFVLVVFSTCFSYPEKEFFSDKGNLSTTDHNAGRFFSLAKMDMR